MAWPQGLFYIAVVSVVLHTSSTEICKDTDFVCTSDKKCIDSSKMCDKIPDCDDSSDEENCACLEPEWYLCKDNTTCISHSERCDGEYNCPNDDDEKNCDTLGYVAHHEVTECPEDKFDCGDGVCLPLDIVCDGTEHCFDGKDETIGCKELPKKCHGFLCKNGHCLTDRKWVCDRENDCGDNSDESFCNYDCTLQKNKFLCGNNKTCISLDKVCNGQKDCPSGDDESVECVQLKSKRDCAKACQPNGMCQNLPSGATCVCPLGYRFNETRQECEDVNECMEFGVCSQGCVNMPGSYNCACAPGFKLQKNNRTCEHIGTMDPLLIYAASKSVNWFSLRSKHLKRVADNLNHVIGVSYDGKHIYWTDISHQVESIMRAKKDGSQFQTLFTAGLSKPEDIAVDYITGNIYFTDNDYQHIAVCSNDGKYCRAIITENVHRPRGIALHPQKGKMYWSDWGDVPMIAVSSMDGKFNKALITTDIVWPNGLTIDWPNNRIYWVDAKYKTIESCKLDGSDRRQVIKDVSKHPYGIALFQDTLYWSDWDSKNIQSCNKFTGKNRTIVIRDSIIYDISVYDPALQVDTNNPCLESDCSHLCLLNSNGSYTCDCPKYMELQFNHHTCRSTGKQKVVMIGIGHHLIKFEHQSFGRHEEGTGKILNYNIDKMAHNSITGEMIMADNTRQVIFTMNLDNSVTREIMNVDIGNVTAMSFDALANNLYWTDSVRSTIEVYSFNTQQRAVVRHFMGKETPIALAAVTEIGKLFVALKSSHSTHIDVIQPDGRGHHFHVLEDGIGNGPIEMAVDRELQLVYWADYTKGRISHTDFDGQTYHTFLYDIDEPVSLANVGEDLFWTSSGSIKLNWVSKNNYLGTKSMFITHLRSSYTSSSSPKIQLLAISPPTVSRHQCNQHGSYGDCSHVCIATSKTTHSCLCTLETVFNDAKNTTCVPHEKCAYRCNSGECITKEQRCDGAKNCLDGSDENLCQERKKYVTCTSDQFTCLDQLKCIEHELRCNDKVDCADGSDEADCKDYNKTTKCRNDQFLCLNGNCIDSNSMCDGYKDCADGEDELAITCQDFGKTCSEEEFTCSNRQCIPRVWVCDGDMDCTNDEQHCPAENCDEDKDMMHCQHGGCISKDLVCNGDDDCGDFSDEIGCKDWHKNKQAGIVCDDEEKKMFQCKNNKSICLDMEKRCNGFSDCPKGEDELYCDQCTQDEFKCGKDECILRKWMCDGQKDCKDGSDEMNCGNITLHRYHGHHYHPVCSDSEFKCKTGECVDWDRVCNDKDDGCSDGSDEGSNCATSCRDSPCQQKCKRSPNGPVCACDDGYTLDVDKKSCNDINECTNGSLPCAQHCLNTKGSYRCSCHGDFKLSFDKISCKSIGSKMFMFYSAYDSIYRSEMHNFTKVKSTHDSRIMGLDMHYDKKLLYFTVEDSDELYEFNFADNSHLNSVKNIGMPTQVAVDWITENVYFIDKSVAIKICHMEKRRCITLIECRKGEHIKSLAIDAVHRRLFYVITKKIQFSMPNSTIVSHDLDGSKMFPLTEETIFVSSITCDFYTKRVYYVGFDTRTIWSVKYDGTGKQLMIDQNKYITRPIGISLFESYAYVLNADSRVVAKCAMYGDRQCTAFTLNVNHVENLVIVQKSRQKSTIKNPCANNECNTICTISAMLPKCICDFGHMVDDGIDCNSVTLQQNQPIFHHHNMQAISSSDNDGSMTKMVLGTLSIIVLLTVLVMGGLFVYKRFYVGQPNKNISIHFENPRSAMEAARVKMSKLNEIMIHRNRNQNINYVPPMSDVYDEQEMSNSISNDDKQRLLL